MAQIAPEVRQQIADAADQYLQAYLGKQTAVTEKQDLYEEAVAANDIKFDQYNIPITELEASQNIARSLYSETESVGQGFDDQMAQAEPIIVAFLSEFQSSSIDFPEQGKRITVSGGNVVVSDI